MNNTYTEFINNILEKRGRFNCDGYKERHHIAPRCMGGSDDKENLIDLYATEHYIAHKLLALENPQNNKLIYAWWMMSHDKNNQKFISQQEYDILRKNYAKIQSAKMLNHNPMQGKAHTPEARIKMSESAKGRKLSQEVKDKLSQLNSGENNNFYGKKHSKKTKAKMRQNHSDFSLGKHPKAKKVYCIELDKEFSCIKEAENITKISGIRQNIKGETSFAGFHPTTGVPLHWINSSDKEDVDKIHNITSKPTKLKGVRCIELNKYFPSVKSASDFIQKSPSRISYCCKHPNCTCGGYHWGYDTS